ncbi:MAG: metallophosphoesterase [Desulfurococcales archaeon]|nr:metallophosphoesterase [Desulfurococcales archaeon]
MPIYEVVEDWRRLLEDKGKVISIETDDMLIIGDIHGYPEIVDWAERLWEETGARYLVFLGDYVDRGPDGPGVLERVGSLAVSEPGRVVTLRGNHEDLYMNREYGFYRQAIEAGGSRLIEGISRLYEALPYAAISQSYFMVHGGIPCRRCTDKPEEPVRLEEIRGSPEEYGFHLMWNDPSLKVEWFSPSIRGAYLYGPRAWRGFLDANGLKAIIRGHEVADAVRVHYEGRVVEGFMIGDRLRLDDYIVVTVFSSRYHMWDAGAIHVTGENANVYRYK